MKVKNWESRPTAIHMHASLHVVEQPNAEIVKIAMYLFVFLAMSKMQKIWNLERNSQKPCPDTGTETNRQTKRESCSKVANRSSKLASQLANQAGNNPANQVDRHRQADNPPARKSNKRKQRQTGTQSQRCKASTETHTDTETHTQTQKHTHRHRNTHTQTQKHTQTQTQKHTHTQTQEHTHTDTENNGSRAGNHMEASFFSKSAKSLGFRRQGLP